MDYIYHRIADGRVVRLSLVAARQHWVFDDSPAGGTFVPNAHFPQLGEIVRHDVAAPGRGAITYRIEHVDARGAWGLIVRNTVREMTPGEVR